MKKTLRTVQRYFFKITEDYVPIHAANSAFFMFMSLFPLIMFIINLLAMLNVSREFLLERLLNVTPTVFHELLRDIIENIAEQSTGIVLSLSGITALWSASSGVYGMMIGLNDVYRTYDTRNFLKKRGICILYTLFFILIVSLSLLLMIYEAKLAALILKYLPQSAGLLSLIEELKYPAVYVILLLFFSLIYRTFPHQKSKFFMHFPGAAASAASWLLMTYLFSLYVQHFNRITLYGSLATIIFFLFWLWIDFYIIYLGAEINAMILDRRLGKDRNELRRRTRKEILEKEAEIKAYRPMTKGEKFSFRKTTTRNIDSRRIREELENQEKNSAK